MGPGDRDKHGSMGGEAPHYWGFQRGRSPLPPYRKTGSKLGSPSIPPFLRPELRVAAALLFRGGGGGDGSGAGAFRLEFAFAFAAAAGRTCDHDGSFFSSWGRLDCGLALLVVVLRGAEDEGDAFKNLGTGTRPGATYSETASPVANVAMIRGTTTADIILLSSYILAR